VSRRECYSEAFYSLQGEGPDAGRPCFFIRFQGCNLACRFCDTPGALRPGAGRLTRRGVLDALGEGSPRAVCVTGGEPLLQLDELEQLTDALRERLPRAHLWLETNGTLLSERAAALLGERFEHVVVSPKLTQVPTPRYLNLFRRLDEADSPLLAPDCSARLTLKFLVRGSLDLVRACSLTGALAAYLGRRGQPTSVVFQPVHVPGQDYAAACRRVYERIVELSPSVPLLRGGGWRLLPQLHKLVGLR